MGKKSRRRPDRKKKDAPAPAAAAPAPAPAAAPAATTGAETPPMSLEEANKTFEEWVNATPKDVHDAAMKKMTQKHDRDAGVKTFVSPTLKCRDCKTNRFEPPAMLCAFCPECPEAQCGSCSIEHGPYNHTVCPKCHITLCLDHAYQEMEDNGTDELCMGMTCFDCEATRRDAEATWKRCNARSSTSEAAPVSAPAPAPSAPEDAPRRRRVCTHCFKRAEPSEPRYLVCSGCGEARYCSEACQREHWAEHQKVCPAGRVCDICGERGIGVCDACGARRYCSPTCQAADWESHQFKCLMLLQMNTIGGALEEIEIDT